MRHVIRADLDCSPTLPRGRSGAPSCAAPRSAREPRRARRKPRNGSLSAAGADPGLGAGERKGRGGRSAVCRRRRARASRRLSARRAARRRGAALPPRAAERRGLRQNPAPQRRRSRAARPPLRRRRPARARGEPVVAVARWRRPAAQPRPSPDSRRGSAARSGCGPERPRSEPEGLRRGGRSGFGGRQGRRPGVLRPPGRPSGPIRDFCALGVRHGHRPPAPLAAARAADRCENPGSFPAARRAHADGQGLATPPGQTPPQARSRSPPPPPSTSPPILRAAPTP